LAVTVLGAAFLWPRLRAPSQVVVVGGSQRQEVAPASPLPSEPSLEPKAPALATSLGQAVARGGRDLENCFAQHVDVAEKMPEATLRFSLEAGAIHARVSVQPEALSKSPLGACLKTAGETIALPVQSKGMSFRVPVRAKFAAVP
jgi:hypothetical protein